MEERCHVQLRTDGTETPLRLFCNILSCQHPCTWCLCVVIHLGDVPSGPDPPEELLTGKEPVHHEVQCLVQSVQETLLSLAVMPVIPHERADDGVVLLFHMRVVVPLVRTGTGEADAMWITGASQFVTNELAPALRVQNQDRGERSEDIDLRTAGDRDDLRPPRTAIGDSEGAAVVPCRLPSVMAHEVYLHVPGRGSRAFPEGDHRDAGKETLGLCPGTMLPVPPCCLLCSQQTVHLADPMWRTAARRWSGIATWSLLLQSSPARWYTQTRASATAGPTTGFRCLCHGEGLVGTSVTSPRTTRFA